MGRGMQPGCTCARNDSIGKGPSGQLQQQPQQQHLATCGRYALAAAACITFWQVT